MVKTQSWLSLNIYTWLFTTGANTTTVCWKYLIGNLRTLYICLNLITWRLKETSCFSRCLHSCLATKSWCMKVSFLLVIYWNIHETMNFLPIQAYSTSRKSLNKRLMSGCVLRLHPPTHRTLFALCSSVCVCVCLRASACIYVRLCASVCVSVRLRASV